MQATETPQTPTMDEPGLCPSQQTKARIIAFYQGLDRRAKLSIVALLEIHYLAGLNFEAKVPQGEQSLFDQVMTDLENSCSGDFKDPAEAWISGVWQTAHMVQDLTM